MAQKHSYSHHVFLLRNTNDSEYTYVSSADPDRFQNQDTQS